MYLIQDTNNRFIKKTTNNQITDTYSESLADVFPSEREANDYIRKMFSKKARKKYLEAHPLCVECMKEGRSVKATDVDHIIPHRGDRTLFWDQSNWQALCHHHHSMKTRANDNTPTYHY